MTRLLEEAFRRASELPETEQDTFAKWLLEELESEREWDRMFAQSQDVLGHLADEAIAGSKKDKRDSMESDCR